MSAQIDAVSWNADDYVQARFPTPAFLQITGGDRHAWTISLTLNNPALGTQTFSAARGNCTFSNISGNFMGTSGQVTFSALTGSRVAGTFTCGQVDRYDDGDGAGSRTITNGAFDVTY
jgi:hypothetical protein